MTYDEAKAEILRIVEAAERRDFIRMLAFRLSVILLTLGFLAWSFAAAARESDRSDAIHQARMHYYQDQIDHAFAAYHAMEQTTNLAVRAAIYREELEYVLRSPKPP